jgi:hypothetical protein
VVRSRSSPRRGHRRPKSDPLILARWIASQDLSGAIGGLLESGITPGQIADLTPHQAFAVLFEEPKEEPAAEPLEALYRINLDREAKGEPPAVPQWWGESLPRKPRKPKGKP